MARRGSDNRRWSTYLQYHWWKYLLLAVISAAVWTAVFDSLARPDRNEKVGIAFFGDGLDVQGLHDEVSGAIERLTDQQISVVDVEQVIVDRDLLGSAVTARSYDCDLLVLTADTADLLPAHGFFCPIPDDWEDVSVYSQERDGVSTAYGVKICGPGAANRFSRFCRDDSIYYVFLSRESVNLAGLNGQGSLSDDAAMRVLEYLME